MAPEENAGSIVVVGRISDQGVPYVPSDEVICVGCGEKCWISKVMLAAVPAGCQPVCMTCVPDLLVRVASTSGGSITPQIPDSVMNEFRDYMAKVDSAEDN